MISRVFYLIPCCLREAEVLGDVERKMSKGRCRKEDVERKMSKGRCRKEDVERKMSKGRCKKHSLATNAKDSLATSNDWSHLRKARFGSFCVVDAVDTEKECV
jgi:hypothetical protein